MATLVLFPSPGAGEMMATSVLFPGPGSNEILATLVLLQYLELGDDGIGVFGGADRAVSRSGIDALDIVGNVFASS